MKRKRHLLLRASLVLLGVCVVWLSWHLVGSRSWTDAGQTRVPARPQRRVALPPRDVSAEVAEDPRGALSLDGQVVDERGHPAEAAQVFLDASPPRQVATDAQGYFRFEGLVGRTYRLDARREDAHAGPVEMTLTRDSLPLLLQLAPGAAVEATVL